MNVCNVLMNVWQSFREQGVVDPLGLSKGPNQCSWITLAIFPLAIFEKTVHRKKKYLNIQKARVLDYSVDHESEVWVQ